MKKQEHHLTDSELAGIYTAKNRLILLEHIRDCPFCSERFAKILSKHTVSAPHYLKQKILTKKQYKKQKKQEFTIYCIKISLAVAASLAIIFLSDTAQYFSAFELRQPKNNITQEAEISLQSKQDLSQNIYRKTDMINQKLISFTDSLARLAPSTKEQKELP